MMAGSASLLTCWLLVSVLGFEGFLSRILAYTSVEKRQ